MKIILDDKYFLKEGYGATFILVKIHQAQDEDAKQQERETSIAYGDLDGLLKRYIRHAIEDKNVDEVITVKEYLRQYKELIELTAEITKGELKNDA